jgi:ceramide glucosyltransferase
MEQLSINVDQCAMAIFASATKLVDFCFGASIAMSKRSLAAIGGLEALADYLTEDNELGRRVVSSGKKVLTIPYVVETTIDLESPARWWQKQTYWEQNSRVAVPGVFVASLALRTIPLSLLFAALRGFDPTGLWVLALAVSVRMTAVIAVLAVALGERASLRSIWLVPIKDVLSLVWFAQAFIKTTVVWRGVEMALTRDGRLTAITPKTPAPQERAS